jgi:hypothetical protein
MFVRDRKVWGYIVTRHTAGNWIGSLWINTRLCNKSNKAMVINTYQIHIPENNDTRIRNSEFPWIKRIVTIPTIMPVSCALSGSVPKIIESPSI